MYFLDDSVFLNNFVQFWLAILGDKISSRSNGIGHFPEGVLFFQCMHLKKFKKRLKGTFKVQVFLRTKKYSSGRFCQIFVAFLEKWPVRFHQIFGLLFLLDNSSPVLYGPFFCLAINDEVSNFWQKNAHPRRYGRSLTFAQYENKYQEYLYPFSEVHCPCSNKMKSCLSYKIMETK